MWQTLLEEVGMNYLLFIYSGYDLCIWILCSDVKKLDSWMLNFARQFRCHLSTKMATKPKLRVKDFFSFLMYVFFNFKLVANREQSKLEMAFAYKILCLLQHVALCLSIHWILRCSTCSSRWFCGCILHLGLFRIKPLDLGIGAWI